jgi:RNA polymerase sigma factor (sigma-70 family)
MPETNVQILFASWHLLVAAPNESLSTKIGKTGADLEDWTGESVDNNRGVLADRAKWVEFLPFFRLVFGVQTLYTEATKDPSNTGKPVLRSNLGSVIRYIRRTAGGALAAQGLNDAQLLARFRFQQDAEAFGALVYRHGPLVRSVCLRVLQHDQDAEDAFQATFLVLAAKASSIHKVESLASWLHGVSFRAAMNARRARRQSHPLLEEHLDPKARIPATTAALREAQVIVDEELNRLAEKYRAPFVLCCLEGLTRAEAAQQLGWKEGTVCSRIAQARSLLQRRLRRWGIVLSLALCVFDLTRPAAPAIAMSIARRTTQGAMSFVANHADSTATSLHAIMLARGLLASMAISSNVALGIVLLIVCGLLAATGVISSRAVHSREEGTQTSENSDTPLRMDMHGDPLPAGALARLGTLRQRAPNSQISLTTDGKEIVALSRDLVVRRFDASTGHLESVNRLPVSQGFNGPWLSSRGTYAVVYPSTVINNSTLELWNLTERQLLWTLPTNGGMPCHVSFSQDEQRVAIATSGGIAPGEVLLWNLQTGKHESLWTFKGGNIGMYFYPLAVISPDGKRIVAAHLDLALRCWDADTKKLLWELPDAGNQHFFFSSDSKNLMSAPRHNSFLSTSILDATTGKVLEELRPSPRISILLAAIGSTPDNRLFHFATESGQSVLWDRAASKVSLKLPAQPNGMKSPLNVDRDRWNYSVFAPDGSNLIQLAGTLQRWDLKTGKPTFAETADWGHTEAVTRIVFSPDGRTLASCSDDRTTRLWDIATARPRQAFQTSASCVAFTPDGRSLVAAPDFGIFGVNEKAVLRRWNASQGQIERDFLEPEGSGLARGSNQEIRITTDGRQLLTLNPNWRVGARTQAPLTRWDMESGKILESKPVPWPEQNLMIADGQHILAEDTGAGIVKLMDVNTGKPSIEFQTDRRSVGRRQMPPGDVLVSPGGSFMSAHLRDRESSTRYDDIRIGDMKTGRQLFKIPVAQKTTMAFSPDDRQFATAMDDKIRIWDTASWKELASVKLSAGPDLAPGNVLALAFSPDGQTIATGHADSTILLWKVGR